MNCMRDLREPIYSKSLLQTTSVKLKELIMKLIDNLKFNKEKIRDLNDDERMQEQNTGILASESQGMNITEEPMETSTRNKKRSRENSDGAEGSRSDPIVINDSLNTEDEIDFQLELNKARRREHEEKLTQKENELNFYILIPITCMFQSK